MSGPAAATGIAPELARITLGTLAIALPFAAGVALGDQPPDVPLEPRYAAVIGSACLLSLAVFAQGASAFGRRACMALALAPLAHLVRSGSPTLAAIDVVVLLSTAASITGRGTVRIVRAPAGRGRRVAAVLALALSVPGPLFTLAWGLVSTTLAPAATRVFHASPEIGTGERAVEFTSRDGVVLRGTFAPGVPGASAVVLVHGRGDSRRRLVPWARELASRGAHVLRFDLRGHGVSEGVAVTFADREPDDVEAALAWLAAQPGVGALHALGVSMGGGATLAAVARRSLPVASTVALAPATDYRPLVERSLPPFEPLHGLARALVRGVTHGLGNRSPLELTPADAVARAGEARVLVIHSRSDTTIPASMTEALVAHAPWVEVEWIDGVAHNDLPDHTLRTAALRDRIVAFLDLRAADHR